MNNEKSDVNEINIYRHKKKRIILHCFLKIDYWYICCNESFKHLIAILKLEKKKEVIFQFKIF